MPTPEMHQIREGISYRRLAEVGDCSLDYVEIEPGSREFAIVHHECDEAWYVLDGELEAMVDGRSFAIHPGDCVPVARHVAHGSHNASDGVVRLLVINQPAWAPEHDHQPDD